MVSNDLNLPLVLTDPISHHRPRGKKPVTLAVVHSMAERIALDDEIFEAPALLRKLTLSVHALIRPDGTVINCVPLDKIAWHAKGFNTISIGCELLVKAQINMAIPTRAF